MRTYLLLLLIIPSFSKAQVSISGTVFDQQRKNYIEGVLVISTDGKWAFTDTVGRYRIEVSDTSSLRFQYRGKPTVLFPVKEIPDLRQFDISLHVQVNSGYKMLPEVRVYSRSWQQDSLDFREEYRDIFEYRKPGLSTNVQDGVAGADLGELINLFRTKRNRRLESFRNRVEKQEEERYINYRFNRTFVSRITQLPENQLDSFMVWFRPSYDFTRESSEIEFNQYILDASYLYREILELSPAVKPE